MSNQLYSGTWKLSRFILRRERLSIPIWIIALVFFTMIVPLAFAGPLFQTAAERQLMAETMKNPAMIAMMGPVYGADNYDIGAMTSNFMLLFLAIGAAVMNIFLVIRHTRRDEEDGRIEMIRSLPVGRLSNLSAAMLTAAGVNTALALVTCFALFVLGVEGMSLNGSLLFGAVMGVTGLLFAAVTAVFIQLTSNARSAATYSLAFMGLMYLLRAAGDVNNEVLACISPLGLILRTQAYVNDYWWPVFVMLGITVAFTAIAFYLNASRDMGEGLIPARPGRKRASVFLQSPIGLGFKLLRAPIIAWAVTMFILAAAYGSILGDLETFLSSNEMLMKIFAADESLPKAEQFISMILKIMAIIGSVPPISFALKIRGEEKKNHLEHLLGRSVSRERIMAGYSVIAFVSSILMLLLTAFGLWILAVSVMDNPINLSTFLGAQMIYLPAIWVMIGLTLLLTAYLPSGSNLSWIYLLYSFITLYLGSIMDMPEWMKKFSPFGHIPQYPLEDMNWLVFGILSAIAAVMTVLGFIGYRRRDMRN